MVFRFKRQPAKNVDTVSPFTEMPEELKHKFSFGKFIRGFFSVLFLLILAVALLALIAAFAYQLIYNPQILAERSYNLISSIQNFVASIGGPE